jgi:hypothetical protein
MHMRKVAAVTVIGQRVRRFLLFFVGHALWVWCAAGFNPAAALARQYRLVRKVVTFAAWVSVPETIPIAR